MKQALGMSLLVFVLVLNVSASDDFSNIFHEGKVSGQIRTFYIDRDYSGTSSIHRNGTSLGGKLKLETGAYKGLSAGAAFYTTNRIFKGIEKDTFDPTLFEAGGGSYSIPGETYLQFKFKNTVFVGGRQKIDTPMAGSDDARTIPNLFEAYMISSTDIKDLKLTLGHLTRFAPGTFANAYNGGVLGAVSGYTAIAGNTAEYQGDFVDMGEWAVGNNNDGVSVVSAEYTGISGLQLQLWDYYAYDIFNAVYAEAIYCWSVAGGIAPYVGLQYIREDDVGDSYEETMESNFTGAKGGVKVADFDIYGAVSHNSKDDNAAFNGGTISPWGGMPAYTQGMVTRHQFMAGTDAWKVAGSYDWKKFGINLNTSVYYTSFDMDDRNGYSENYAWTATETGFDIIYYPESIKNLQLRFRGNFPRDFKETASNDTSWSEYRLIVNYNF